MHNVSVFASLRGIQLILKSMLTAFTDCVIYSVESTQ